MSKLLLPKFANTPVRCHSPACVHLARYEMRLWVPQRGWHTGSDLKGVRVPVKIQVCGAHRQVNLDELLTDTLKSKLETLALIRNGDRRLDFDKAFVQWVDMLDPEIGLADAKAIQRNGGLVVAP